MTYFCGLTPGQLQTTFQTWISPALWEAEEGGLIEPGVQDQPGQHSESPNSTKNTKLSQAWWHTPIVPATWEAEWGGWLEAGRLKLQ